MGGADALGEGADSRDNGATAYRESAALDQAYTAANKNNRSFEPANAGCCRCYSSGAFGAFMPPREETLRRPLMASRRSQRLKTYFMGVG